MENPTEWKSLWTKHHASIPGWLEPGVDEILFNAAKFLAPEGTFCEIGSYKGLSTVHLAAGCKLGGGKLLAVDPFFDKLEHDKPCDYSYFYEEFTKNISICGVNDVIEVYEELSSDAYLKVKDRKFSGLFLDGDHTYEGISADWHHYVPLVNVGGLVMVHDSSFEGPAKLLEEVKADQRVRRVLGWHSLSVYYKVSDL